MKGPTVSISMVCKKDEGQEVYKKVLVYPIKRGLDFWEIDL